VVIAEGVKASVHSFVKIKLAVIVKGMKPNVNSFVQNIFVVLVGLLVDSTHSSLLFLSSSRLQFCWFFARFSVLSPHKPLVMVKGVDCEALSYALTLGLRSFGPNHR
jgi:hypothetical protein